MTNSSSVTHQGPTLMGVCQTIFHFDPQAFLALPIFFLLTLAGKHRHNLCGSNPVSTPVWP